MPNYNPTEETSLLALLAALKGGMSPTTGYQMFQDVLNQQAARVDARQQRLSSLQDLLTSEAREGQSLAGVQALADAYTPGGGVPPRIENTINALYPMVTPPTQAQSMYAEGTTPSELRGVTVGAPGNVDPQVAAALRARGEAPAAGAPASPQTTYSPMGSLGVGQAPYQSQTSPAAPPIDPVAALQQQAAAVQAQQDIDEATAQPAATLGDLVSDINAARAKRTDPATIRNNILSIPEYAELATKNFSALNKMFPAIFPDRSSPLGR